MIFKKGEIMRAVHFLMLVVMMWISGLNGWAAERLEKSQSSVLSDTMPIKEVSLYGGAIVSIDGSGDYIVFAQGEKIKITNVTNLHNIFRLNLVGEVRMDGGVTALKVFGDYIFAGVGWVRGAFRIIDIHDPSNPVVINKILMFDSAIKGINIDGNKAYVNLYNSKKVYVIDITQKDNPVFLQTLEMNDKVMALGRKNDVLILALRNGDIVTIDVSDVNNPTELDRYNTGGEPRAIFAILNRVFVADKEEGLIVLDIGNASNITLVKRYDLNGKKPTDIFYKSGYIYIGFLNYNTGLTVLYMDDKNNIRKVGDYIDCFVLDIAFHDSIALISDGKVGLYLFDATDQEQMEEKMKYKSLILPYPVAVNKRNLYLLDCTGMVIMEFPSKKENGTVVWRENSTVGAYDLFVDEHYAYEIDGNAKMKIFDINNPHNPQLLSTTDLQNDYVRHIKVVGNYAYIIGYRLFIYDISDKAHPIKVGEVSADKDENFNRLATDGRYLYTIENDALRILDVRDKTSPTKVGTFAPDCGYYFSLITAIGDKVYLYDENVIFIVDVSDKQNPKLYRKIYTSNTIRRATIVGSYAITVQVNADGSEKIVVIDMNKEHDNSVGTFNLSSDVSKIICDGQYMYVGEEYIGLRVLHIPIPYMEPIVSYLIF
jgi:hypothetical protein